MIAAIASLGPNLDSPVASYFGRAPYFVFVDLETGDWHAEPNPGASAFQAAGLQAAQFVVSKGANVVALAGYVGPNAEGVLAQAGVTVQSIPPVTVREAIEILKGRRPEIPAGGEIEEIKRMLRELERKIEKLEKRLS